MRRSRAVTAALILAASLLACERAPAPPQKPPPVGSIKVVALTPDTTTPLKVGEKVRVQADVEYRLAAESGTVSLVVQANNASLAQAVQAVKQGAGKASLSAEFVVPDAKAIQVFTPLQARGQSATSTVALRTYKVVGK